MGENIIHTHTLPTAAPEIIRQTVSTLVPGVEDVRKKLRQVG
jgi:hypothetical protein